MANSAVSQVLLLTILKEGACSLPPDCSFARGRVRYQTAFQILRQIEKIYRPAREVRVISFRFSSALPVIVIQSRLLSGLDWRVGYDSTRKICKDLDKVVAFHEKWIEPNGTHGRRKNFLGATPRTENSFISGTSQATSTLLVHRQTGR